MQRRNEELKCSIWCSFKGYRAFAAEHNARECDLMRVGVLRKNTTKFSQRACLQQATANAPFCNKQTFSYLLLGRAIHFRKHTHAMTNFELNSQISRLHARADLNARCAIAAQRKNPIAFLACSSNSSSFCIPVLLCHAYSKRSETPQMIFHTENIVIRRARCRWLESAVHAAVGQLASD